MIGQKSAKCDRRVCRVRVTLENAYLEWKNTAWSTWPAWPCDPCTNVTYVIEAPQVTYVTQSCVSVTHISDVKKNSTWPTWPCDPSTNVTDVARVTYVTQFCDPVTHVSDEKNTMWPCDQRDPVIRVPFWPMSPGSHMWPNFVSLCVTHVSVEKIQRDHVTSVTLCPKNKILPVIT